MGFIPPRQIKLWASLRRAEINPSLERERGETNAGEFVRARNKSGVRTDLVELTGFLVDLHSCEDLANRIPRGLTGFSVIRLYFAKQLNQIFLRIDFISRE